MSYDGGMLPDFRTDVNFAKEAYGFLKKVLLQVSGDALFRGPEKLEDLRWYYDNDWEGNVINFIGREHIWMVSKIETGKGKS